MSSHYGHPLNPCMNGGLFKQLNDGGFQCICRRRYSGPICEVRWKCEPTQQEQSALNFQKLIPHEQPSVVFTLLSLQDWDCAQSKWNEESNIQAKI